MKSLKLASVVTGTILIVGLTVVQFGNFESRQLRNQVAELERERTQLVDYAQRLSATRRVAQVTVVRQTTDETGRPINVLLWQEIRPDGVLAEPLTLEVVGRIAYFEALVIKFMHQHVGEGDADRGASLALFRRVFGDGQAAETVTQFDRVSQGQLADTSDTRSVHAQLWKRFWEFVDDPRQAARYGVRVAQIEAPAIPLRAGHVWEITLDAAGGLNLRKLGESEVLARSVRTTP